MIGASRRRTAGTYRRQPWSTWAFTLVLLVAVGVTWPEVVRLGAIGAPYRIPWPILAAGFTAGHVTTIRFEFSGELQEVTLSEVPLLIGVVFAGPDRLLLASAVGCGVSVVWSHHPPIKAVFNLAMPLLETALATICFHLVLGQSEVISVRGLLAALVAVPAANVASTVCIQVVIALSVRRVDVSGLKTLAAVLGGVAILNVSVAMVAVVLLWTNPLAAVPFLVIAVALGFGYRSHGRLRRQHRDLEEIYRFSRVLAELTDADEVIKAVLTQAKTRLRAELAELTLEHSDATTCYTLRGNGPLTRGGQSELHPLQDAAAQGGVLARKTTGDEGLIQALTTCGFRDAVAVTLPAVHNITGTLVVADRSSDQVTFEPADLELLEVLANLTASALHAAQLLSWLRQEVAEKNHLALHDTLTDLPNRALYNQEVEAALTQRTEQSVVAVMLMDLDRFKEINDTLGHQTGDLVLQQIARQLTRAVGHRGSVGRIGGDEFAFVVVAESRSELAGVARDVLAAGRATVALERVCLEVSASLGVAVAPDHGRDRSSLLRAADVAMYRAKANGGGLSFYEPDLDYHHAHP